MTDGSDVPGRLSTQMALEQQIRLRHLRVLLAVADSGGITRASERLGVTQTAVSKAVAEVEDILGSPILERKGRGVILTRAGEYAVSAARRIAAEVHVLSEDLDLLREGAIGLVTIGMQAVSAKMLLAQAIAHMKTKYPRATIQIVEGLMPDLLTQLRAGRMDLVIGRLLPVSLSPDLTGFPIDFNHYVVVASPNHPLLQNPDLTLADILGEPWWLPMAGTPIRDHFDKMLKSTGLDTPVNLVESNSASTLALVLNQMQSFSIAPQTLADHWAESGLVSKTNFSLPALEHPIGLIWSKQLALGPTARIMRQSIFHCHEKLLGKRITPMMIDTFTAYTLIDSADQGGNVN